MNVVENGVKLWMDTQTTLKRILALPNHPSVRNIESGELVPAAVLLLACKHMAIFAQPLKSISPVAWRNVNLIGNFDFTTSSSPVDIEALAACYQNEEFWRRSLLETDNDGPE